MQQSRPGYANQPCYLRHQAREGLAHVLTSLSLNPYDLPVDGPLAGDPARSVVLVGDELDDNGGVVGVEPDPRLVGPGVLAQTPAAK